MRELKFRCWDWKSRKLIYSIEKYMEAFFEDYYEGDNFEQYTGLKDRDGKEIYEGDIVWWEHYNGMNGKMSEHKGEVYYDEKLGGYFVSHADTSLSELIMEEEVYVNTNIHEETKKE